MKRILIAVTSALLLVSTLAIGQQANTTTRELEDLIAYIELVEENVTEGAQPGLAELVSLLRENDNSGAEKLLETLLSELPNTTELLTIAGGQYFYTGNLNRAERFLVRAGEAEEGNSVALAYLGSIYLLRSDMAKAEEYFSLSMEADPTNKKALLRLGTVYAMRGDPPGKTLSSLRRAYPAYSEDAELNVEVGQLYYQRDEFATAGFFFDRAVKLGDDSLNTRLALAKSMYREEKYQPAYKLLKKLGKQHSKDQHVQYYLGATLLAQKKYPRALNCFRKAERLDRGTTEALYYAALCQFNMGLHQQAMNDLISYRIEKIRLGRPYPAGMGLSTQLMLEIEKVLEVERLPHQMPASTEGMATIPSGLYAYGKATTAEESGVSLRIQSFSMDKQEVSNEDYAVFVAATGWSVPKGTGAKVPGDELKWDAATNTYAEGHDQYPVVFVTWEDAMAYAAWCGKRLPTEMEWEYAARGGLADSDYPWSKRPGDKQARFGNVESPWNVGEGEPNGYGLLNIVGNAAEWCLDPYFEDFRESLANVHSHVEKGTPRSYRGGHWRSGHEDLVVNIRRGLGADSANAFVGFRCVADQEEEE